MTSRALSIATTLVTLAVIVGFLAYSHATREMTEAPVDRPPALTDSQFSWPWPPQAPATSAKPESPRQSSTPAESVNEWIVNTTSDSASIRADAITLLATTSSAQAVPALARILISGDKTDRQLALKALSKLAQARGDADGRIRSVLRQAIYHTDDDDVADSARATLDEVERAPSSAMARPAR